jgi:putative ABC transport system permease protein
MMPLAEMLSIYRARLRARHVLGQEALAVLGIAIGVALLFASQVASTSMDGSVRELSHRLVGSAQFQLDARGPEGVSESLVDRALLLPGVRSATPLLEQPATIQGRSGNAPVDLIGVDRRIASLAGGSPPSVRWGRPEQGLGLPAAVASSIGAHIPQTITIQTGSKVTEAAAVSTLKESTVGSLVDSQIVLAPLAYAQRIANMPGRITRIFVQASRDSERRAGTGLAGLASREHVNLLPAEFDARMFAVASAPAQKGEQLFSAISAIVGFLFAFNAMLLTVPERRKLVEGMRRRGATRPMTVQMLAFDALVLGTLASAVGLAIGEVLSARVFHVQPGYLALAFPVGTQRLVTGQTLALAVGAGMLAALFGVMAPMWNVVTRPIRASTAPVRVRSASTLTLSMAGLLLVLLTAFILLLHPQAAVPASLALLVALLCLLPVLFKAALASLMSITRLLASPTSKLALVEMADPYMRVHLLAVAATGAVAVFGSVAIQGAQRNLQSALNRTAREWSEITPLWVSAAGVENTLATTPFATSLDAPIERLPDVASVQIYRGSLLNIGDRRLWVIAPPRSARALPVGQLTQGAPSVVSERLSEHGWLVLSETFAHEHNLRVGDAFTLPSPIPMHVRIAGLSTNSGWAPGIVVLNADDYARAWGTASASAFNVTLRGGVTPSQARQEIEGALGRRSGLIVQTDRERERAGEAISHQGLARLSQIGMLILLAAILAVAGVMSSMIWHRRSHLGALKRQGFGRGFLWRSLLCESAVLIGSGCAIGAVFGLYGEVIISHALASVTGFPTATGVEPGVALTSVAFVCTSALCILAVPGYMAVRTGAKSIRHI